MNKIERKIVHYLKNPEKVKRNKNLSERDHIYLYPGNSLLYVLWNSPLVSLCGDTLNLGVRGARWQSKTTKRRLNAIAREFGLPGITQKNYQWKWDDGQLYTGIRTFILGNVDKLENSQYILGL
jgi:hypothetical protein